MRVKEFLTNAKETILDPRWSRRFKLLNVLSNDRLREDVAFARMDIIKATDYVKHHLEKDDSFEMKSMHTFLSRATETLDDIFSM